MCQGALIDHLMLWKCMCQVLQEERATSGHVDIDGTVDETHHVVYEALQPALQCRIRLTRRRHRLLHRTDAVEAVQVEHLRCLRKSLITQRLEILEPLALLLVQPRLKQVELGIARI